VGYQEILLKAFWLAALTAVLWGIVPILDKIGLRKASSMAALSIRSFSIAVALLIFILATGYWKEAVKQDSFSLLIIAIGGLAAGLFGQLAYFQALKLGTTASVVPVVASYPLIASALAITILREPISPGKVIGAVLVVAGASVIALDKVFWPSK
jgi:transporter family protein